MSGHDKKEDGVLKLFQLCVQVGKLLDKDLQHFSYDGARNAVKHYVAAYTDELTGLPNRFALEESIQAGPPSSTQDDQRDPDKGDVIVAIDLDKFKPINDTHGHPAGDRVLQEFATRLKSVFREDDMVGVVNTGDSFRLGGDEFIALLRGCDTEGAEHIKALIQKKCFADPVVISDDLTLPINGSIGFSHAPKGVTIQNFDNIMKEADQALYDAKPQKEISPSEAIEYNLK